ncbi:MAG: transposase [Bacteroidales bacterium]|jgi:transposase-like protein
MAKLEQFQQTRLQRQNRYFSEEFKKRKVSELDQNITSIEEISKEYEVSRTSIYKWIYKYSLMRKKGTKQVVEADSDTNKIKSLKEHIKALEQALGQKQMLIDFQSKVIDLAEEEYQVDIKKKFGDKPSFGIGTTGESTK